MTAYYNEIDPYCAQWLRNLVAAGLIPAGDVDERPIEEVSANDVRPYTQAHFFAGIGGWAYAARLAGWPDDRPIWTGSCPCQPFSNAGKRLAYDDPRNLWPDFARLIQDCRPPIVAGEQVASKAGRLWLAGVRADLEALGYGVGAADLCAAGVGAPHIRQRLWWVAESDSERHDRAGHGRTAGRHESADSGDNGWLGNTPHSESTRQRQYSGEILPDKKSEGFRPRRRDGWHGEWVRCADEKARRIEPGIEPLAHGVPARVGKLRAYGNAIVPQVAAELLTAYIEATEAP